MTSAIMTPMMSLKRIGLTGFQEMNIGSKLLIYRGKDTASLESMTDVLFQRRPKRALQNGAEIIQNC